MKKYIIPGLILITLVVLSGCNFNSSFFNIFSGSEEEAVEVSLPADLEDDVPRSSSRSFSFETLLPVRLVVDVDFYSDTFELLTSGAEGVVVQLKDGEGRTVFGGVTRADGTLDTEIRLPAAPEDMTLCLYASGYGDRIVGIPDMVGFEEINRTMAMVAEGLGSRSLSGLTDSDNDGVPDVYDAYPDDPDSAFAYLMPAGGSLTVAYEDLFGNARAGDADYNDFLAHYSIEESSGSSGITAIHVEATAAVKLAGYNHSFGIRINSFVPPADLTVNYIDEYGRTAFRSTRIEDYPNPGETSLEVVLFENTAEAVGKDADFTLTFVSEADDLDNPQDPESLSRPPYNPYLYVKNTGHDVHLIDEEPVYGSSNPDDTFRDADGFPWGLLVPPGEDGWEHPAECQRIEEPYPRFTRWRESGGELSPDWYLHYDDPWVEPQAVPLFFSSDRDGDFEIYSLDIETDTLTQLTSNDSTDKHPDVSADGSMIAFVSDRSGSWGIYTMNADGSGVSDLLATLSGSSYGHPSWSPDGTRIAFDNSYEIYTMNSDGSGEVNMTNTVFTNEMEPSWSPDGTLIAFSSRADGDFDIHTMNADGSGNMIKLTVNSMIDRKPSWSPDGTQIAFSSNMDSDYEIYLMNSDGSDPVNMTNTAGDDETSPCWSEQGIAFVRDGEIYSLQPDVSDSEVNLTNNSAVDQDPCW